MFREAKVSTAAPAKRTSGKSGFDPLIKSGRTVKSQDPSPSFYKRYKNRLIFGMISMCLVIFGVNMYHHFTVFSYNNIIRRVNNMEVIPIEDLQRIEIEYPMDALPIMRSAMANLIQSTIDPKKRLALEVQQYWNPKIFVITQKNQTEVIVAEEITASKYKEMISRADEIIDKWEKYASDAAFWRATRDKRVLRFSRNIDSFSIPYPLLEQFAQLYPLPGAGQTELPQVP